MLWYFGPKSREILTEIFGEHFSNDKFKFGTAKEISLKNNKLIFQRLSFVGELGWEIYVPINISREIYLELVKVGEKYNLSHAGAHALDIMRMEKDIYIGVMIFLQLKTLLKLD